LILKRFKIPIGGSEVFSKVQLSDPRVTKKRKKLLCLAEVRFSPLLIVTKEE